MSYTIFKDKEHQAVFDRQGYLKAPFLGTKEIGTLLAFFYQEHPELPQGRFYSSSYANDYSYKRAVSDFILKVFQERYEVFFTSYRAFGGAFLCKTPGEGSDLMMHQDWTIVDESRYLALNIWVPLVDVSLQNGCLQVLPGSHRLTHQVLRAPTLPFFFKGHETLLKERLLPLEVKAGEAVILDQSLVHYSAPNLSDKARPAITAGILSAESPMRFHYRDPNWKEDRLELFEMEDDFLISFENFAEAIFKRPLMGKSHGFIPYRVPEYSETEMLTLLDKMAFAAEDKRYLKQDSPKSWRKWVNKFWAK